MSLASRPASRWAVSARTSGEVLTAGISRAELELTVLGIPAGFSQLEIEGWLHDLAGVAVETSKADQRARALPALMHHALTGLLFSHAELWDKLESPRPCSSAFVDLPEGAAFGWVGDARVHVLVDGDPVEPQWVRVRDDEGREARAAVFAPGSDVVVTLEYWPEGGAGGAAPASLEAEWVSTPEAAGHLEEWASEPATPAEPAREVTPAWFASAAVETAGAEPARAAEPAEPVLPAASGPAPAAFEEAPAVFGAQPYPELPESLPVQQPGLATAATDLAREASGVPELVVPLPRAAAAAVAPDEDEPARGRSEAATHEFAEAKPQHPVARWLSRVMNWGRPDPRATEPRFPEPEPAVASASGTPVSAYDSLLSESVPATSLEQTALELPGTPPESGAPGAPAPAAATSPATLRPAGIAEILGAHATVTSAPSYASAASAPAAPVAPPLATAPAEPSAASPSGSIAINEKLQALLREIEAAEAGTMPVISPQLPGEGVPRPLEIDHEPVGADEEGFGIPRLPSALQVGPREEDRFTAIPPLPPRPFAAPLSEFDSHVRPQAPARLEIESVAVAPVEPSVASPVEPVEPVEPVAPVAPVEPVAPAMAPPQPVVPETAPPAVVEAPLVAPSAAFAAPPVENVPGAPPVLRVKLPTRPAAAGAGPSVALHASEPAAAVEPPPATAPEVEAAPAEDVEPLFPQVTRRARTLEGPELAARPKFRLPPRAGLWAAGIVVVFVLGWLVGGLANPGADRGGPLMAALRAVGLGGARFTLSVNSSPGGAQVEVDGKVQTAHTPTTIELPPGEHVVRLVLPGLGAVEVPVKGRGGEKVSIDESLNGRLEILGTDSRVPISVSIDGKPAGYAPLEVESIAPGLHEIGFSGPGMPAWAQTVQVEVRGTAQLVARPMSAPANGVIQVQATLNDERGASALQGAQVHVDGELRGVTPLSVELPRGPHSLRVAWRGETAPVQVIDLPGGNQRFASFQFGLDTESPRLTPIGSTKTFPAGQPKVVSASVEGLEAGDVGEAWLHVRTPDGLWRRYAMTVIRGASGLVVTSVFPDNVFDKQGSTRWYVRVVTPQGDEAFSEVQRSSLAGE